MKLVMTLLVRDEEDILREHLEYHLNAGVDLVLATDHRSSDGTTEILRSYAADGAVVVAREEGEFAQQAAWQTRMARAAATDHGADWVIASDADEFWWPRGDSLKDVLARVPRRYGVVYALMQNFVPRSEGDERFLERMIVRLAVQAPINDPATPFRPVVKVAHRGDPRAVIEKGGGHDVRGVEGEPLRSWHPLEVLHFPFRSREQSDRKYRKTWTGWERNPRADLARAQRASVQGRSGLMWDRLALDDADIERGIEARSLVTDVRLRDAVRGLRDRATSPATSRARYVLGVDAFGSAVFSEAEVVRLQRWLDDVHRRVTHIERRP
jgi:glycosyl transferase family 2